MLKKADAFRFNTQRPKPRPKAPRRAGPVGPDTSQAGVSASDKRKGNGHTAPRNVSIGAERKATFVLEDSATGRPSRKSTRKSSNHAKPDSNLQRRQTRRTTSPKIRAARGR